MPDVKQVLDEIVEATSPIAQRSGNVEDFGVALLAAYLAFAMAVTNKTQPEAIDFTIEYLKAFKDAGLNVLEVQGNA